ncbi:uncharacterized protein PHA67_008091 isoform 1-T1 [Liasis olivaceus]
MFQEEEMDSRCETAGEIGNSRPEKMCWRMSCDTYSRNIRLLLFLCIVSSQLHTQSNMEKGFCSLLDQEALLMITQTLVTNLLDFYHVLYMGLPQKTNWKLQLVQNAVAEIAMDTNKQVATSE